MKILSLILSIILSILFGILAVYLSILNGNIFFSLLLLFASYGRAKNAEMKYKSIRGTV